VKLEVKAANTASIVRITNTGGEVANGEVVGQLQFYSNDGDGPHISSFIKAVAAETWGRQGELVFGVAKENSTDAVEAMRIDEDGNVGIGTTAPKTDLDIGVRISGTELAGFGTATLCAYQTQSPLVSISANIAATDYPSVTGISLHNSHTTGWDLPNTYSPYIAFSAREDTSANYLSQYAVIAGQHKGEAVNNNWQAGDITFWTRRISCGQDYDLHERLRIVNNGDIIGTYGNYHVSSDIRNKENIVTIPDALSKVLNLRGVNFTWKDGSDGGTLQMGMIAQEAELVVPEIVHTVDDAMKTKSIEYPFLTALLVEAIKDQQVEIEKLKVRIDALEAE